MKNQSIIGRLKEEKDGQQDSLVVRGIQPWQWAVEQSDRPTKKTKGGNQRSTPDRKHGGGGLVYDWRWVKVSF
jgi:hypothetical protein